jgi:hypothetical protein
MLMLDGRLSTNQQVEALGKNNLIQDITFANSTGTVSVFTVTGDVLIRIIPIITTDCVPNTTANIRLGVVGNTDAMIVDSASADLDARGIWVDQTPDNEIEPIDRIRSYIVTDGNDVVLTLDAQVNSGVIRFYGFWTPISGDGMVINA